jgi:hypothetical protein
MNYSLDSRSMCYPQLPWGGDGDGPSARLELPPPESGCHGRFSVGSELHTMSIGEAAHNSNIVLDGSGIEGEHRAWQLRHSHPRLHELRNHLTLMCGSERFGAPVD